MQTAAFVATASVAMATATYTAIVLQRADRAERRRATWTMLFAATATAAISSLLLVLK